MVVTSLVCSCNLNSLKLHNHVLVALILYFWLEYNDPQLKMSPMVLQLKQFVYICEVCFIKNVLWFAIITQ